MHMKPGNATLTNGSAYGPGTGEQLVLCEYGGSYYETFIEECYSLVNPDARRLCTHDRDIGVRCQPGPCKLK